MPRSADPSQRLHGKEPRPRICTAFRTSFRRLTGSHTSEQPNEILSRPRCCLSGSTSRGLEVGLERRLIIACNAIRQRAMPGEPLSRSATYLRNVGPTDASLDHATPAPAAHGTPINEFAAATRPLRVARGSFLPIGATRHRHHANDSSSSSSRTNQTPRLAVPTYVLIKKNRMASRTSFAEVTIRGGPLRHAASIEQPAKAGLAVQGATVAPSLTRSNRCRTWRGTEALFVDRQHDIGTAAPPSSFSDKGENIRWIVPRGERRNVSTKRENRARA